MIKDAVHRNHRVGRGDHMAAEPADNGALLFGTGVGAAFDFCPVKRHPAFAGFPEFPPGKRQANLPILGSIIDHHDFNSLITFQFAG
jgi:hypothetical protein